MKKIETHFGIHLVFLLSLTILFLTPSCSKQKNENDKPVKYTKLIFNTESIRSLSVSTENLLFTHAIRIDNSVFCLNKGIWKVDLKTGKEEFLFQHGVGPNEIYHADNLSHFNGRIYAQSMMPSKYLFHFSPAEAEKKQLTTLSFNGRDAFTFDDFVFISENVLALAFPYWEEGLVRFYDLEKKEYIKGLATPTVIPLMKKFNINAVSLCTYSDKLYVAESIKPEVKIISVKTREITNILKLSPPFYIPLSSVKEARADKYNNDQVAKWMAKWSKIRNLIAADGWLMIKYQWGYDARYSYELINVKKPHQRYYIDEIPYEIFDMKITGNRAVFTASEEREEELAWLEWDVQLQ